MSKLSKNLKTLRKQIGLSQERLAEKLGIKRKRYATYEEYRAEPNCSVLIKLSDIFGVSIDDLIKKEL